MSCDKMAKCELNYNQIYLENAATRHALNPIVNLTRKLLVTACSLIFGVDKSIIAARRISFELSWRLLGHQTFTARGWVGRMFPYQ